MRRTWVLVLGGAIATLALTAVAIWAVAARDANEALPAGRPVPPTTPDAFTPSIPGTPWPSPTPILTPGPRPDVRANCFPGGCTSSTDGPPTTAPANLEWVLAVIPRLEAAQILTAEIRGSHLSSEVGLDEEWAAYLWTNFGQVELVRLPPGEEQFSMLEVPGAAYTPTAGDSGVCPWNYRFTVGSLPSQGVCSSFRMFLVVGDGLIAQAFDEAVAERVAAALGGRRVR